MRDSTRVYVCDSSGVGWAPLRVCRHRLLRAGSAAAGSGGAPPAQVLCKSQPPQSATSLQLLRSSFPTLKQQGTLQQVLTAALLVGAQATATTSRCDICYLPLS